MLVCDRRIETRLQAIDTVSLWGVRTAGEGLPLRFVDIYRWSALYKKRGGATISQLCCD